MNSLDTMTPMSTSFELNLPYGIGTNYALPYAICRGSIFSAVEYVGKGAKNRPVYVKPVLIATYGDVQVYQTAGEQLNQGAADVYAELVRIALQKGHVGPNGRLSIRINADAFLKSIGRDRGLNNRLWLADEVARLKRASYRYEMPGLKAWETSFIAEFTEDRSFRDVKASAEYVIELNARMVQVFQQGWALLDGDVRRKLHQQKNHLAKALYAFYATHRDPQPISAKVLKRLTGRGELLDHNGGTIRREQQNSKWLKDLGEALAALKKATGWGRCELVSGMIHVRKIAKSSYTTTPNPKPKESPLSQQSFDDWGI